MEAGKFRFKIDLRVRNYEVDWQGIVHNTVYLLYCEVGRVEYLKHIGATVDLNTINGINKIVLSRNEINYIKPARFDMMLEVYTRISEIGNSSFIFESLIIDPESGELIAENRAYHVWLDSEENSPQRVPEDFRKIVRDFEGNTLSERGSISRPDVG
jgi:acyl-CoA thioester hydrolase